MSDLLNKFGHHLYATFKKNYPVFFQEVKHPFDLLERIDNHIHVEVKKLYPDAELPSFETHREGTTMTMIYRSERKMADLALGLIEASSNDMGVSMELRTEALSHDGTAVKFISESKS